MDEYGVSVDAPKIYDVIHSSPGVKRSSLCDLLPIQPDDAAIAVDQLLELGLIEADSDGRLYAMSATSAVLRTCLAVNEAAAAAQRHAQRLSSVINGLDALRATSGAASIERLVSLDLVRQTITELAAQANVEILTSQPGGPRPADQLEESVSRTREALSRGVKMRTLYQWSAQFGAVTKEFAHYLISLGAEVRITHDSFMRLLIFDRKAAVISLKQLPEGAMVVYDPDIVDFAVQAYERAWTASHPFPVDYVKDDVVTTSDKVKLSIIRLLTEGHSVSAIGKRLGISSRTCQRHISEIMQRLGARNRLHAGYLISEKGLLRGSDALRLSRFS